MINRVLVLFVAGCLVFGSVIVVELMSPDVPAPLSAGPRRYDQKQVPHPERRDRVSMICWQRS